MANNVRWGDSLDDYSATKRRYILQKASRLWDLGFTSEQVRMWSRYNFAKRGMIDVLKNRENEIQKRMRDTGYRRKTITDQLRGEAKAAQSEWESNKRARGEPVEEWEIAPEIDEIYQIYHGEVEEDVVYI